LSHLRRTARNRKKRGSHFIHFFIGALGGKHHSHEQSKGIDMIERNGRLGVQLGQFFGDKVKLDPTKGGGLFALDVTNGKVLWQAPPLEHALWRSAA
jgi:hypothetical protein